MEKEIDLPEGIKKSDLKYPADYKNYARIDMGKGYEESSFELWLTQGFGWVLPTLQIGGSGRAFGTRRTYGITLKDKKLVSVGRGPHVLKTITVHLTKDNLERVKPYIELYTKGMQEAGSYRDSLSSRRANSRMRRSYIGY